MNARVARLAGALVVVAWAVVQLEGRRPRSRRGGGGMEIERKFLVAEMPNDVETRPGEAIEQGYLAIDGDVELRVRRKDESDSVLTVKAGSGESRVEEEFEIDSPAFESLWPFTAGRRLRKIRRRIPGDGGLVFELDSYLGWLRGLFTVEVEFPSLDASRAFQPPEWVGAEVTSDPSYKNQSLAQREGATRAAREFRLRIDEPVPMGIARITAGQIGEVLDRLEGRTEEELGKAVHESRKSLKRLRAVARLVRVEVGTKDYRRANAAFRDAGRRLSGPRDAQILIRALDALGERYRAELSAARLGGFRARLVREYEELGEQLTAGSALFLDLAADLRKAEGRVEAWSFDHSGFRALAPGLETAYRGGRGAYRAALLEPTPEHLHEWRKRVKDLWYSVQLLEAADPRRMKKLARAAHELSELLGDDHDLVVLEQQLASHQDDFPDENSPLLLYGAAERRRLELQVRAFGMGAQLYGERPRVFVRQVERGWRKRGGRK
jgi:CYTH domain-containing protein/CHAD domain-containing protein